MLKKIIENAFEYDLFQLVRLLKIFDYLKNKENISDIIFHSNVSLSYPIENIQNAIIIDENEKNKIHIFVNFMGLIGVKGTLPLHDRELVIKKRQLKDNAMQEIMDIFNHRIIDLFIHAHRKNDICCCLENFSQNKDLKSNYYIRSLSNIIGINSKNDFEKSKKDAIYIFRNHFSNVNRSAKTLERMICYYLNMNAKVKEFYGRWFEISQDQYSRISKLEANNQIGISLILGGKIWDMKQSVRIILGPIDYIKFMSFIPNGENLKKLSRLVKRYIINKLNIDIQLELEAASVPLSKISQDSITALGWNSWINSGKVFDNKNDTIISLN